MKKDDLKEKEVSENKLCENLPVYESEQLFGQQNEIIIKHRDAFYRLRITKNGKLIMNK